jgi:hypothetical protein
LVWLDGSEPNLTATFLMRFKAVQIGFMHFCDFGEFDGSNAKLPLTDPHAKNPRQMMKALWLEVFP